MGFWTSPTGQAITGDADKAFIQSFQTIPEGTTAVATIKVFEVVEKPATDYAEQSKFIQITYKLLEGDFKGREVQQKIKVFDGKPEQIERSLNMLMRVMKLCDYKPSHNNEPTTQELSTMCGKILGIMIGEWSMPKKDGTGVMDGNFVREVHSSEGFASETGEKAEVVQHTNSSVETAFSRNNKPVDDLDEDLPF